MMGEVVPVDLISVWVVITASHTTARAQLTSSVSPRGDDKWGLPVTGYRNKKSKNECRYKSHRTKNVERLENLAWKYFTRRYPIVSVMTEHTVNWTQFIYVSTKSKGTEVLPTPLQGSTTFYRPQYLCPPSSVTESILKWGTGANRSVYFTFRNKHNAKFLLVVAEIDQRINITPRNFHTQTKISSCSVCSSIHVNLWVTQPAHSSAAWLKVSYIMFPKTYQC